MRALFTDGIFKHLQRIMTNEKKNDQKHSITNNLCSDIAISFDEKIYASKDTDIEGYRTEHIIQLKVEHAHNDKQKKQKSLGNAT